jgi:hypothetical protein
MGGGRIAAFAIGRIAGAAGKLATTRPSNSTHFSVTPYPIPVILAKARIQSRKRNPLRLWILGRAQDDGRGGRNMSLAIDRRAVAAGKPATTRTPSVIPAKAGTQSPKRTRPRP